MTEVIKTEQVKEQVILVGVSLGENDDTEPLRRPVSPGPSSPHWPCA
ncbi:MAG: hypothetical protein HFH48_10210, partial [Lachnospiraceae bacterium]|nr:hypothetical protein [Lachnospiraceae bacterium]